ncbi:MAG: alginate lyase family protein [Myxococcota bacterium]
MGPRIDARYRARAAELGPPRLDHPGLAAVAALRCGRTRRELSLATASDAVSGRFTFHGKSRELGNGDAVDWQHPELNEGTRLWKTQLHEFSYALDLADAARTTGDRAFHDRLVTLISDWSRVSPIGHKGFALDVWNARAVATRLINWSIAAAILEVRPADPLFEQFDAQLAVHALFLADNLELDLRGNHLLRDYVGLVFCHELLGSAPNALALLRTELDEQLLEDGCHFERSPLYHSIVLQDLVECRALLAEAAPDWLSESIARMAGFLAYLLPEDRQLPLHGDTWHGEVDPSRVLEEAGNATIPPRPGLPERASGIVALESGPTRALLLAGAHGPDYQMGHTHADGLSFELYRGPGRVITDTGTCTYNPGPRRIRVRSTAAHNTVQIDGEEQLEAWGSFRAGRRGRGRVRARGSSGSWDWIWATHDGYRWLRGKPLHHRLLAVSESSAIVLDWIGGGGTHNIRTALHLHPDAVDNEIEIAPMTGTAGTATVELHERFNESRQMTEIFVETTAELPWLGGWAVDFQPGESGLDLDAQYEANHVQVSCKTGAGRTTVSWDLDAAQVEFSPH